MTSTTAAPRLYLNDYSSPTFDRDAEASASNNDNQRRPTQSVPTTPSQASSTTPGRQSRFAEDIAGGMDSTTTLTAGGSSAQQRLSSSIDPASIPTRTSSSKAVANSKPSTNGIHQQDHGPKSPNDVHPAMRAVPEESDWLSSTRQSHTNTHEQPSLSPPTPTDSHKTLGNDLIHAHTPSWSPEKEKILFGPYDYLYGHPGKDIRQQMIAAFDQWLQVPAPSLAIITKVVGMLHTSSLLIDDVEDSSHLRRGVPVAHAIFGTAQTINSANYIYFCALQELLKLPHNTSACIEIYTSELLNLHRGQGMDLFWRDTLTCPSEDDYLEMVNNKTGGLFRLAIKLMCAQSPSHQSHSHSPDYIPLVNTIGLLFQILDDYRNLQTPLYSQQKGSNYEDLTEGKFSFPIIHSIRSDASNLVLINILKQKTDDEEVKRYAVAYMEGTGSFGYTRKVLRGLVRKALGLVEGVDGGRGRAEGVRVVLERMRVGKGEGGGGSGRESEGEREGVNGGDGAA